MPVILSDLEKELAASPLVSPYSLDLAIAVVADAFRRAGQRPPPAQAWIDLGKRFPARYPEQLGMLAHLLASTSLGAATSEGLARTPTPPLLPFFEQVEPLTAEMIRANVFRREEFVRKWLRACGGAIANETAAESEQRARALDYRTTLAEYTKAEASRQAEAAERARILREAEEREAAARGWRE